jgi:hypothetical protein
MILYASVTTNLLSDQRWWLPASIFVFLAALVAFIIWIIVPPWLRLGKPAITISKEGLTFANNPLILWPQIEENVWYSQSFSNGDEYTRTCDLYRQAASQ